MTEMEFKGLQPGDRVSFSLSRPRGAVLTGVVTACGLNSYENRFASVEWDGQREYSRFSYILKGRQLRRLKKAETALQGVK